jgi:small-conductance mechanosensitive channel
MPGAIVLWFVLLFSLGTPALGAPEPGPLPANTVSPGVAEVIPRLSQLIEDAGRAESRIGALTSTAPRFEAQLAQAGLRQGNLSSRLADLGKPETWRAEGLLEIHEALAEQKNDLKKLLEAVSSSTLELDSIQQNWNARREFWAQWERSVPALELNLPLNAFNKADATITGILDQVAKAFSAMILLQKEVTVLQEINLQELTQVEATLEELRGKTFKKTAPSFADPGYYQQFGPELWGALRRSADSIQTVPAGFLQEQGWILLLQGGIALALGLFIRRHRNDPEVSREWQFILHHPWATGSFVAIVALNFLYSAPPALWRLLLWILLVTSASLLVAGLLANRRKIFMVYYLATLFLGSQFLQYIAFPPALYRLYLALTTLLSIPLLLWLAARNRQAHQGRSGPFTIALKGGSGLCLVLFLAECSGYTLLASRVFEAALKTVFLGLFAAMAVRLVRGGVEYLFTRRVFLKSRFVRRSGSELAGRLKDLFDIFVVGYALVFLLVVWGFFDSLSLAWERLLAFGFHWGEKFISAQMVLLAALVIYLAIVASWTLRALLEWEVFPRKGMDRGVRDAIKKLLHYTLVFVGFLLAVSLAGIELKNFAVLAGALGIGIGFGLQNIVNNFVSGIILLFERPIKVGDVVFLDEEWGTVRKIGLRSTIVETVDQSEIIVPNSDLVSQKVTNWTLSTKAARIVLQVGVAYGSDLEKVLGILLEAGQNHAETLEQPPPSAIFLGFGDSSLNFELRVWVPDIGQRLVVRSDLGCYVDRRFREEEIEIPFPQRDLHLRSVDQSILRQAVGSPSEEKPDP